MSFEDGADRLLVTPGSELYVKVGRIMSNERVKRPVPFAHKLNESSSIGRVIGVVSGKGGVGKSTVTALLAQQFARKGLKVGIMDADITGPSIPRIFGLKDRLKAGQYGLIPCVTSEGIKVVSMNLLLDDETEAVIYRGPVIAGAVKQFWSDVYWGDLDVLFIDMPPGTGDVPLTVYQSLPIDGVVIVSSPQQLVSMIVTKAYDMANKLHIPVLGLVENYSYYKCPDCGSEHYIFGESKADELAGTIGCKVIGRLPIDPALARLSDEGRISEADIVFDLENE